MPARQVTGQDQLKVEDFTPYVPNVVPLIVEQSTGEKMRGFLFAGHVQYYSATEAVPAGARQIYVEPNDGSL